ncbi:MAG: hypothetical protein IT495_08370 [Gammaproteobacteria bacterium]|nr:hypothetical protein [Gammaproteobacteria bacterium]
MHDAAGENRFEETQAALRALGKAVQRWRRAEEMGELFAESPVGQGRLLAEQELYERWLRRERWRMREEALPLLFGVDPDAWPRALEREQLAAAEATLWALLDGAHRSGPLAPQATHAHWTITPVALWTWARSLHQRVPAAFEALVQFIANVVRRDEPVGQPDVAVPLPLQAAGAPIARQHSAREQILGAALNLLAKYPEACRDEHGFADARRVVARMQSQAAAWFDDGRLPVTTDVAVDLIEPWLR